MSSVKVECVVKASALIGEGPVWEESEQTLLFVDIGGQKIHRWSPSTNEVESLETGEPIGCIQKHSEHMTWATVGQWVAGPSFNQGVGGSIPALVDG